jgi:hypothetical protein
VTFVAALTRRIDIDINVTYGLEMSQSGILQSNASPKMRMLSFNRPPRLIARAWELVDETGEESSPAAADACLPVLTRTGMSRGSAVGLVSTPSRPRSGSTIRFSRFTVAKGPFASRSRSWHHSQSPPGSNACFRVAFMAVGLSHDEAGTGAISCPQSVAVATELENPANVVVAHGPDKRRHFSRSQTDVRCDSAERTRE